MKTMDCTPINYGKPANRAVTVRCITCGLEVTGVEDKLGQVRPSDRGRPEPDAPVKEGYCWSHIPGGPADRADLNRRSRW